MVNLLEMMNILELHRQGMSTRAIAQLTGKDRKTVRKYISDGLKAPQYKARPEMPSKLDPFVAYLRERVRAWPLLSGSRLLREIRQQGYTGGKSILNKFLLTVRPAPPTALEVRFETDPGEQAQVDFAEFKVAFHNEAGVQRKV